MQEMVTYQTSAREPFFFVRRSSPWNASKLANFLHLESSVGLFPPENNDCDPDSQDCSNVIEQGGPSSGSGLGSAHSGQWKH